MRFSILVISLIVVTSAFLALVSDQAVAGGSMAAGTVYTRNYMGDYRATGWANVTATNGVTVLRARSTSDGRYQLFLSTGNWDLIANVPGYKTVSKAIAVPDGGSVGYNFYLEESGVPIPEFQEYATPLITAVSFLLVITLLRKRTLQKVLN